ncbi:glycoside hydrolase family 30 protein [Flavobacterium sp.]|uniref:glycoside hydrolase family 30 protein n=1 Tax=Flavobacterium sp. TaxID=239 RepID=UPI001202DF8B|nr:glycoside hydrolase family 30 protein [Flavobacterium sp.]RZJ73192.1 MAG: beta-glycosidase [Flavobacterium sp.]
MRKTILFGLFLSAHFALAQNVIWVSSTEREPWQRQSVTIHKKVDNALSIDASRQFQVIDGFGSCFNELGWTSLSELSEKDRNDIFKELFQPNFGANFNSCRMPIGANDFSRDWYSYDETDQDFDLKDFSIKNDLETLIPFIKSAQKFNKKLTVWASPWSPPSWMKYNKHYALSKVPDMIKDVDNGLSEDQIGKEGNDMFIQEDRYFQAYAKYFGRFISDYKKQGIAISMVMPQNEFNSAQWYPSCTWTPNGLSKFISCLGPEMEKSKTQIFFGTLERPNDKLFQEVFDNPEAGKYIKGVGLQWAGKEAISKIHAKNPDLKIYQSEHECGNGENSWAYAEYSWDLMKHYFLNGANAYFYWNTSLLEGGVSRWGWKQNSLVTVNKHDKTYKYNPEFYVMKHLSHFVKPGAHLIDASTKEKKLRDDVLGWWKGELDSNKDDMLAFANPDGSVVIVVYNATDNEKTFAFKTGKSEVSQTLKAKSFNTFLVL